MSILSESYALGDIYLISIKLKTDKWEEYFHPELFKEGPDGEPSEIMLVKNIIRILSGFEEYMMEGDMWLAQATDLFTCETQLGSVRFTPVDGEIEVVVPNYQTGRTTPLLTIFLNADNCPTIF